MVQVGYSANAGDLDEVLRQAERACPGQPIRVRIQPQVWVAGREYITWKRVSWPVRCASVEEARALRLALEAFFVAVGQCGPEQVCRDLYALDVRRERS